MTSLPKVHKLLTALLIALLASIPAYALTADQATVISVSGMAQYQKAGVPGLHKLEVGAVLYEGDSITTDDRAQVVMELSGKDKTAQITIRPNSKFVFRTFQHEEAGGTDTTLLDVSMGTVLVKAEKLAGDSKFEVKTPTSIVGIRGTAFEVKVERIRKS